MKYEIDPGWEVVCNGELCECLEQILQTWLQWFTDGGCLWFDSIQGHRSSKSIAHRIITQTWTARFIWIQFANFCQRSTNVQWISWYAEFSFFRWCIKRSFEWWDNAVDAQTCQIRNQWLDQFTFSNSNGFDKSLMMLLNYIYKLMIIHYNNSLHFVQQQHWQIFGQ